jgi:flagellar assembly factor FliW
VPKEKPVSEPGAPAEIVFADGLVGLPQLVRHRLAAIPETALYELASLDDDAMGFIAAELDSVKPGATAILRERGLVEGEEWVLVILAVHGEPPEVTANLAGPIVIDMKSAKARQLVIEDSEFPLQAKVSEQV